MIATIPRAVLALSAVLAAPASPMPRFTGERLYVVDVPDRYQAVDGAIRDLEARSPRAYYVAVVKTAGARPNAARDYAERLREAWRLEGRFDADSSVIVVAALDDRQIAVLPSRALVDRAGLSPGYVEREIIRPRFVPLARDGDYPGALVALLEGIETRASAFEQAGAEPTREVATTAEPTDVAPAREITTTGVPVPVPATPARGSRGTDLAWSIVAVAGVLAGMVALLVWLGRRRARGAFRARLKDYKTKAVAMMDRLDGLKARLKALPIEDGDFVEPMAGDTLALYERAQADLRKLWDRWLEVMDVVDRAEKHGEKGAKGIKAGAELVADAKVFEEVEAGAVACSEMMDRLNAAHEDARAAAQAVEEARSLAAARVEAVAAVGLPIAPYNSETDRIAALARQADALIVPDPLGARGMFDLAKADAEALAGRAGDVVARREEGVKLGEELAKLREDVAANRRDGLRLDEHGGNPDDPAARADQALSELRSALDDGDPAGGATSVAAARSALEQGRGMLDSVIRAREVVTQGLPEARRESRRLAEAVAQYAAFEEELRRGFAPESWRDVAGHMTQARWLLETFDRKADEVEQESDPRAQKYLLASRLLVRLNLEQRTAFELMHAVGVKLTALKGVREQARRLADELAGLDQEVREFFRRNDAAVGGQARGSFQAAAGAREEAVRAASAPRPDWPSALRVLSRAREEYGIARAQAQTDVDVHRTLMSEYDEVRRHAARVEALLAARRIAPRPIGAIARRSRCWASSPATGRAPAPSGRSCWSRSAGPGATWSSRSSSPGRTSAWRGRPRRRSPTPPGRSARGTRSSPWASGSTSRRPRPSWIAPACSTVPRTTSRRRRRPGRPSSRSARRSSGPSSRPTPDGCRPRRRSGGGPSPPRASAWELHWEPGERCWAAPRSSPSPAAPRPPHGPRRPRRRRRAHGRATRPRAPGKPTEPTPAPAPRLAWAAHRPNMCNGLRSHVPQRVTP
jgi:uncharacterized membrane protein YgcG